MSPLDSNFIPTKEASRLSGYNADYLARLCRSQRIRGVQIGRSWMVDRESLITFIEDQTERKRTLAQALSKQREIEYQEIQKRTAAPVSLRSERSVTRRPSIMMSPIIALIATVSALSAGIAGAAVIEEHASGAFAWVENQYTQIVMDAQLMRHMSAASVDLARAESVVTVATLEPIQLRVHEVQPIETPESQSDESVRAITEPSLKVVTVDLSSLWFAYKNIGEGVLTIATNMGDVYLATISNVQFFEFAVAVRDTTTALLHIHESAGHKIVAASSAGGSLYIQGIYTWSATSQQMPRIVFGNLYTLGETMASGTAHVLTTIPASYEKGIAAWVEISGDAVASTATLQIAFGSQALRFAEVSGEHLYSAVSNTEKLTGTLVARQNRIATDIATDRSTASAFSSIDVSVMEGMIRAIFRESHKVLIPFTKTQHTVPVAEEMVSSSALDPAALLTDNDEIIAEDTYAFETERRIEMKQLTYMDLSVGSKKANAAGIVAEYLTLDNTTPRVHAAPTCELTYCGKAEEGLAEPRDPVLMSESLVLPNTRTLSLTRGLATPVLLAITRATPSSHALSLDLQAQNPSQPSRVSRSPDLQTPEIYLTGAPILATASRRLTRALYRTARRR